MTQAVRRNIGEMFTHHGRKAVVIFKRHPLVDFGQLSLQFIQVALGQTASDKQLGAWLAPFGGRQDVLDRFLFGTFDEAAGVDQHQIGRIEFVGQTKVNAAQGRDQIFTVGKVFGAAEADKGRCAARCGNHGAGL